MRPASLGLLATQPPRQPAEPKRARAVRRFQTALTFPDGDLFLQIKIKIKRDDLAKLLAELERG
jgi:hypothetical protein